MCRFCNVLICQNCIDKINEIPEEIKKTSLYCHDCQNILDLVEIQKITKRGLDMLHVKCPSKHVNCFKDYSIENLYKHIDVCQYFEGKAKCDSCGKIDYTSKIKEHLEECVDLEIPCSFCGEEMKREELEMHVKTCNDKPKNCKTCNIHFDGVNMNEHPSKDKCMIYLVNDVSDKLESKENY